MDKNEVRAKAEIAIEKILVDLKIATGLDISNVTVDTQNFASPVVEIFFETEDAA